MLSSEDCLFTDYLRKSETWDCLSTRVFGALLLLYKCSSFKKVKFLNCDGMFFVDFLSKGYGSNNDYFLLSIRKKT